MRPVNTDIRGNPLRVLTRAEVQQRVDELWAQVGDIKADSGYHITAVRLGVAALDSMDKRLRLIEVTRKYAILNIQTVSACALCMEGKHQDDKGRYCWTTGEPEKHDPGCPVAPDDENKKAPPTTGIGEAP